MTAYMNGRVILGQRDPKRILHGVPKKRSLLFRAELEGGESKYLQLFEVAGWHQRFRRKTQRA